MATAYKTVCFATVLVSGFLAVGTAEAGDFSNAANYNAPYGMNAGQENQAPNPTLRDLNGNLTAVNGQITSGNVGMNSGVGTASAHAGAGTSGAGAAYGGATAIGNQINVVTLGNNNTVVVNATQTNNGNQTATTTVNGQ
ncbi:MAG: holdfast anchoring protein HfaA [Alphaproteobacteria bacterium]|nr:holdfast anchoring protein HfaA [Alphaproteobacteria bacterium]MBV9420237.1 holdfast anchoring protein HfaA [Alphaproteobacteria bacterium]MBV9540080.1 holdfast anchoring protein HfaA [Alphaproteobacteria bacterium]MBV9904300.1 holdfast anchoring protein HfaA [Alphaproteobacteria bacterium]